MAEPLRSGLRALAQTGANLPDPAFPMLRLARAAPGPDAVPLGKLLLVKQGNASA
jgi:hypothetical protein